MDLQVDEWMRELLMLTCNLIYGKQTWQIFIFSSLQPNSCFDTNVHNNMEHSFFSNLQNKGSVQ